MLKVTRQMAEVSNQTCLFSIYCGICSLQQAISGATVTTAAHDVRNFQTTLRVMIFHIGIYQPVIMPYLAHCYGTGLD